MKSVIEWYITIQRSSQELIYIGWRTGAYKIRKAITGNLYRGFRFSDRSHIPHISMVWLALVQPMYLLTACRIIKNIEFPVLTWFNWNYDMDE